MKKVLFDKIVCPPNIKIENLTARYSSNRRNFYSVIDYVYLNKLCEFKGQLTLMTINVENLESSWVSTSNVHSKDCKVDFSNKCKKHKSKDCIIDFGSIDDDGLEGYSATEASFIKLAEEQLHLNPVEAIQVFLLLLSDLADLQKAMLEELESN